MIKRNKIIVFFLVGLILVSLVMLILYSQDDVLDTRVLEVRFSTGNTIGVNTGTDLLDYGLVPPGMMFTRTILIDNPFEFDIILDAYLSNNIEEFFTGETGIVIPAGDSLEYSLKLLVPPELETGDYSGELKLLFRKFE